MRSEQFFRKIGVLLALKIILQAAKALNRDMENRDCRGFPVEG